MKEKKLTGYPSIDKPWLKYYSEEDKNAVYQEMTMYQMFYNSCKEHLEEYCIEYYGNKISYKEFVKNVGKTVMSLDEMGIKKGDIVTVVSMQTPETLYVIYALNYIGAIANLLYMTMSETEILEAISNTKSKALFILDVLTEKATMLAKEIKIPIVVLSVEDSMPLGVKVLMKLKKRKRGILLYRDWIAKTRNYNTIKLNSDSDVTAIIVYTSGTTGTPKGVMLSNNALNSIVHGCQHSGKGYKRGETFLDVIPPFLGFGISMNHLGLCTGIVMQIFLDPEPDAIAKKFVKYKSNRLVYGPRLTDSIITYVKGNLEYLGEFTGGGEAISLEKEKRINEFLSKHKASTKYTTGYGMTEATSVVAYNLNNAYKEGSAGIPLPTVNVKIINEGIEQKYNSIGEIYVNTKSIMQGYYNNRKATLEVLDTDENGQIWLRTGDLGYIDNDGFIFITGRNKRIFTVFGKDNNLYKLFPQRIEEYIESLNGVEKCAVIVLEDEKVAHIAIAYVEMSINSDSERLLDNIKKAMEKDLPEHLIPKEVYMIQNIPLTTSGKIDYRALEDMC